MNRILYRPGEPVAGILTLKDERAKHIRNVLKSAPGDELRLGRLNGPLATGTVESAGPEGVRVRLNETAPPPRPETELLLALPRPKVLRRLLPQIAALGVRRLYLTNAARVERPYFDTHILEPQIMESLLIEGLTQAGDTWLPEVRVVRQLKPFLEDELSQATSAGQRRVLHPGAHPLLQNLCSTAASTLLAIGPEGGWIPYEMERFEQLGFATVSLGPRILRSDTATLAALALTTLRA